MAESELAALITLLTEPPPEQAELQEYADMLSCPVVGYNMYGKETGRAWPKQETPKP